MDNEYYNHTNYEYSPEQYQPTDNYEPDNEPKKEKKKKGGSGKKWVVCICMALVFGLLASVTFCASNYVLNGMLGTQSSQSNGTNNKINATTTTTSNVSTVSSDIADTAEAVMPSVVSITNMSVQQVQDWFFGTRDYEQQSSGSGIIIGQNDTELLLVTNNHVVEDSKTLTVTFIDGSSAEAQIKGTDSDIDLAIIAVPLNKLSDETKNDIKTATLGDSDALRVGEPTIAIGNALGYGQSVTNGIVSALGREIEGFDTKLIQTNAAINPGNSGGALLNAKGEVIGINTVKVSSDAVEGMGYAIPISDVSDILDNLMNRQTRTKVAEERRGVLGIEGSTINSDMASVYNVPEGVVISKVIEGGGAEKAGLVVGTVITKLDEIDVDSIEDLKEELEYHAVGEKVTLTVLIPQKNREYQEKTVEVTLGKQS